MAQRQLLRSLNNLEKQIIHNLQICDHLLGYVNISRYWLDHEFVGIALFSNKGSKELARVFVNLCTKDVDEDSEPKFRHLVPLDYMRFAFLFNCNWVGRTTDSMTVLTKRHLLMRW